MLFYIERLRGETILACIQSEEVKQTKDSTKYVTHKKIENYGSTKYCKVGQNTTPLAIERIISLLLGFISFEMLYVCDSGSSLQKNTMQYLKDNSQGPSVELHYLVFCRQYTSSPCKYGIRKTGPKENWS